MAEPTGDEKRDAHNAGLHDGTKGDLWQKNSPRTFDDDELWDQYQDGYHKGLRGEQGLQTERPPEPDRQRQSRGTRQAANVGSVPNFSPDLKNLAFLVGVIVLLPAFLGYLAGTYAATRFGWDAGGLAQIGGLMGGLGGLSFWMKWRPVLLGCLIGMAVIVVLDVVAGQLRT